MGKSNLGRRCGLKLSSVIPCYNVGESIGI